jgi:hypothetical protein
MSESAINRLRQWRGNRSLEEVCDLFPMHGFTRPSIAKLSRIERDQKIPLEDVPAVAAITGIPVKELRPDLAKMLGVA